jgi:hypothetical protein
LLDNQVQLLAAAQSQFINASHIAELTAQSIQYINSFQAEIKASAKSFQNISLITSTFCCKNVILFSASADIIFIFKSGAKSDSLTLLTKDNKVVAVFSQVGSFFVFIYSLAYLDILATNKSISHFSIASHIQPNDLNCDAY